jgi:hypothetical protein
MSKIFLLTTAGNKMMDLCEGPLPCSREIASLPYPEPNHSVETVVLYFFKRRIP